MIVILFQEYYLNDNIYIYIYDITSNNVYKETFMIVYKFNPLLLLGYPLLTVVFFSIFVIAIVLHAAVCQLA